MSSLIVHSDSYLAMDLQKFCDPATNDNDATVSMRETQAILNTTEGWSVAVSGFAVDLSRSFYFHEADPNVVITYRSHIGDTIALEDVRTLDIRTFSFAQFIQHLQPRAELRDDLPQIVVNEVGGIRIQPPRRTNEDEKFSVEFSTEAANKLGMVVNHASGPSRSAIKHQIPKTVQTSSGITSMCQRIHDAIAQTLIPRELTSTLSHGLQGSSDFTFDVPAVQITGIGNPLNVVLPLTIEYDTFSKDCTTGLQALLGDPNGQQDLRVVQRVQISDVDPNNGNCEVKCFLENPFFGLNILQGEEVVIDHPLLLDTLLKLGDIASPPMYAKVHANLITRIVIDKRHADRLGNLYKNAKPFSWGIGEIVVDANDNNLVTRAEFRYTVDAPLVFIKNGQPVEATFGGDYDECHLNIDALVAANFAPGTELEIRPLHTLVRTTILPALYRPPMSATYESYHNNLKMVAAGRPSLDNSFGISAELFLNDLRNLGDEQEALFATLATNLVDTAFGTYITGVVNQDRGFTDLSLTAVIDAAQVTDVTCATVFEQDLAEGAIEFLHITFTPPSANFTSAFTKLPGQMVLLTAGVGVDHTVECIYHHVDTNGNIEVFPSEFLLDDVQDNWAGIQNLVNNAGVINVDITMGEDSEYYGIARRRLGDIGFAQVDQEIHLHNGSHVDSQYALPDSLQTFSSIGIVSRDLLVTPVISGGYKEALLHQFPLPMSFGLGLDKDLSVSGASYSPPGVVTWRTRGYLLPHKIVMGNSPLTRFSISATLRHKDKNLDPVLVKLPPHGEFSLQMLMLRNAQA